MTKPPRRAIQRFALALALLWSAAACGQPADPARAAYDRARALLQEHAGIAFDAPPPLRTATREALLPILQREQERLNRSLLTPDQMQAVAKKLSEKLAGSILGKFALDDKAVYLLPEAIDRTARAGGLKAGEREDLRLCVLIHELVHAHQELRLGLSRRLDAIRGAEEAMVFNAMIEGHAEFVSRRVADRSGLSDKVRQMAVRSAAGMPVESSQQALEAAAQEAFHLVYVRGRAFFEAVHARGGDAAVASAFRDRWPSDTSVILHPERFFEAAAPAADWDRLFAGVDALLPGWQVSKTPLGEGVLRAGLSVYGFPKERVDAALEGFVDGRMWTCKAAGKDLTLIAARFRDARALATFEALDEEGTKALVARKIALRYRKADLDLGGGRTGREVRMALALPGQTIETYTIEYSAGALTLSAQTMSESTSAATARKAVETVAAGMPAPGGNADPPATRPRK